MGHNKITVVWKANNKLFADVFFGLCFLCRHMFSRHMRLINGKIVAQKGISYAQGPGSDQSA